MFTLIASQGINLASFFIHHYKNKRYQPDLSIFNNNISKVSTRPSYVPLIHSKVSGMPSYVHIQRYKPDLSMFTNTFKVINQNSLCSPYKFKGINQISLCSPYTFKGINQISHLLTFNIPTFQPDLLLSTNIKLYGIN